MKQPTSKSCSHNSSKEDVFLAASPQTVKNILRTTTSKTEDMQQSNKDREDREATATDEFVDELTLSFPVAINIDDIAASTCGSTLSSSVNAQSATTAIERNKCLATGGGGSRLTVDEEDRLSKILAQDDDENYKDATSTREVELDSLLTGLGYNIELEEEGKDNDKERGDPVLRRLAKERTLEKQKKRIDQALQALLREPLPPVVRNDDASLIPSTYDHDTVLTTPLTEDDIQDLIEKAKKELDVDKLSLADHESIRMLAQSIVDEESSKISST